MWRRHAKPEQVEATLRWLDEVLVDEPERSHWRGADGGTQREWAHWLAGHPKQRDTAFVTLLCALEGPCPLRLVSVQRAGEIDIALLPVG